jgi:hypothetical protein
LTIAAIAVPSRAVMAAGCGNGSLPLLPGRDGSGAARLVNEERVRELVVVVIAVAFPLDCIGRLGPVAGFRDNPFDFKVLPCGIREHRWRLWVC